MAGFTLIETVCALFISSIAVFGSIAALLFALSASHRIFSSALEADDANVLSSFLSRDMEMASHFSFVNQEVWITEDNGTVNSYWLDPASLDVDRAVDGEGAVVMSTHVQAINFSVLPEGGLGTTITYGVGEVSYEAFLQDDFGEGRAG